MFHKHLHFQDKRTVNSLSNNSTFVCFCLKNFVYHPIKVGVSNFLTLASNITVQYSFHKNHITKHSYSFIVDKTLFIIYTVYYYKIIYFIVMLL